MTMMMILILRYSARRTSVTLKSRNKSENIFLITYRRFYRIYIDRNYIFDVCGVGG